MVDNKYGLHFLYQYDEGNPRVHISMHQDATLDEVCAAFSGFLRAAGYSFDGEVAITDKESTDVEA